MAAAWAPVGVRRYFTLQLAHAVVTTWGKGKDGVARVHEHLGEQITVADSGARSLLSLLNGRVCEYRTGNELPFVSSDAQKSSKTLALFVK